MTRPSDARVRSKERIGHEDIGVQKKQIMAILPEHEAGAKVTEVCRKHGNSSATFCVWKAKSDGKEPSAPKRRKALEDENAKVKRPIAEAMLDSTALKDLL